MSVLLCTQVLVFGTNVKTNIKNLKIKKRKRKERTKTKERKKKIKPDTDNNNISPFEQRKYLLTCQFIFFFFLYEQDFFKFYHIHCGAKSHGISANY